MKKIISVLGLLSVGFCSTSQNVGIGTTTPQAKLDVKGSFRTGGLNKYLLHDSVTGQFSWSNSYIWAPNSLYLMMHSASAEGLYYGNSQLEYRNSMGNPVFFTNWSKGHGYFSKRLGIGRPNPDFPLSFPDSLGEKISFYGDSIYHYGIGIQPYLLQIYSAGGADIALGQGSSSSFTETMRIKENRNVGIGTTNPLARLHVADSSVLFSSPIGALAYPGNVPVSGPGKRMMWYADKAAFRVGYVNGDQWDQDSIGDYSFASGSAKATGISSTALGSGTARGLLSTALGWSFANGDLSTSFGESNANGYRSLAMGYGSNADGQYSTAIGFRTTAKAVASLVIGQGNDINDNPDPANESLDDRLFQVGNGSYLLGPRHNAFTILRNGRTGIGTPLPLARLHVVDSSVVFSVAGNVTGGVQNPPISGAGRRMMWYSDKAAFRVGYVNGDQWDKDNIGEYSFAAGQNTKAYIYSVAMGENTIASWYNCVAMGRNTIASGSAATAFGDSSIASGGICTAIGAYAKATGFVATSIGERTVAKAWDGMAVGVFNDISDNPNSFSQNQIDRIFQIGVGTGENNRKNAMTVLRNGNIGIGVVSPSSRLHIGSGTVRIDGPVSPGGNALSIGGFGDLQVDAFGTAGGRFIVKENGNVGIGIASPSYLLSFPETLGDKVSFWGSLTNHYGIGVQSNKLQIHTDISASDIVFGFGSSATLTETMRIKGTGNVGIGTAAPSERLHVIGNAFVSGNVCGGSFASCSDIRYKKDITPINNSLSSVLSLNGIYYHWKKDEFPDMQFNDKRQLGFSAQEVEKLFPEIVMTDANGYKSVDYGRLTPVLVEAMKEQQQQIDELKKDKLQMQEQINELKKSMQKLINK